MSPINSNLIIDNGSFDNHNIKDSRSINSNLIIDNGSFDNHNIPDAAAIFSDNRGDQHLQSPHEVKNKTIGGDTQADLVILRNIQKSVNYKPKKKGFKFNALTGDIEINHLTVGDGGIDGPGAPTSSFTSRARAYQSGNDSHSFTGLTQVLFDAETYDGSSEFDLTTRKFTATTAGYYVVCAAAYFTPNADQEQYRITVKVGSNGICQNTVSSSGTIPIATAVSDILSLSAADTVALYVDTSSGSNFTVRGGSSATYMSIHRIS